MKSLIEYINESLRIGINDKPESDILNDFLDNTCLCIVKQKIKNSNVNVPTKIFLRDLYIDSMTPQSESTDIHFNVSAHSSIYDDLSFNDQHYISCGDDSVLIRMTDNTIVNVINIIINPRYTNKVIEFLNNVNSMKKNMVNINDIIGIIGLNEKDIETEIGRANYNEACEFGIKSANIGNDLIRAISSSKVSESLRIGINDQPEIDFDQDLSKCYILSFFRNYALYKAVYRFEEYNVSSVKNEGDNIYTISAETIIDNSRGFDLKGITFKYDEDLNLFYLYTQGNNSNEIKLYILFFENDERIERMYPILANALAKGSSARYAASAILNVMLGVRDYDKLANNIAYTYLSTSHTCDMNENEIKNVIHNIGINF